MKSLVYGGVESLQLKKLLNKEIIKKHHASKLKNVDILDVKHHKNGTTIHFFL